MSRKSVSFTFTKAPGQSGGTLQFTEKQWEIAGKIVDNHAGHTFESVFQHAFDLGFAMVAVRHDQCAHCVEILDDHAMHTSCCRAAMNDCDTFAEALGPTSGALN